MVRALNFSAKGRRPAFRSGYSPTEALALQNYLESAVKAFNQGNLPLAAGTCEDLLDQGYRHPDAVRILALTAMHIKEYWRAAALLSELQAMVPGVPEIKEQFEAARRLQRESALRRPDGRKRFLV